MDAWGRVQIDGQVPQRLVPAWKTTEPVAPAVTIVKKVVPFWAWLVVVAGILLLMVMGCSCWLWIGLRRKRRQEAAAAAAAASGHAPPGWVVAEPVLQGERQHKRGLRGFGRQSKRQSRRETATHQYHGPAGASKPHMGGPNTSPEPAEHGSNGRYLARRGSAGAGSTYANVIGAWGDGEDAAPVASAPQAPPSRRASRTISIRMPPHADGAGADRQQRGPAHLPAETSWGQWFEHDPAGHMQEGSRSHTPPGHMQEGNRYGSGQTSKRALNRSLPIVRHVEEPQEAQGDWMHGRLPGLPETPRHAGP